MVDISTVYARAKKYSEWAARYYEHPVVFGQCHVIDCKEDAKWYAFDKGQYDGEFCSDHHPGNDGYDEIFSIEDAKQHACKDEEK